MREKPSVSVGIGKSIKRLIDHPWFVTIVGGIIVGIILYFLLEKFDILMEIYRIVWDYRIILGVIAIVCTIVIGIALFILYKIFGLSLSSKTQKEVEEYIQQAYTIFWEVLGDSHPDARATKDKYK
jgi:hypothetical protein